MYCVSGSLTIGDEDLVLAERLAPEGVGVGPPLR